MEIAFTTLMGSGDAAKTTLAELKQFTATTPLQFSEVAQAARSLMNACIAAEDVQRQLGMLGDVATGTQTDLSGMSMIYTQVMSKGKADTQDLMQLANRGVPIFKVLSETLGLNGEELRKFIEAGKVGFPEIQAAFVRMTGQGGQFQDAMKNASGSFDQLTSTMGDAWTQVQEAVGKVITDNLDLKGIIGDLTSAMVALKPFCSCVRSCGARGCWPQQFRRSLTG